jgi:hypothetical protein
LASAVALMAAAEALVVTSTAFVVLAGERLATRGAGVGLAATVSALAGLATTAPASVRGEQGEKRGGVKHAQEPSVKKALIPAAVRQRKRAGCKAFRSAQQCRAPCPNTTAMASHKAPRRACSGAQFLPTG